MKTRKIELRSFASGARGAWVVSALALGSAVACARDPNARTGAGATPGVDAGSDAQGPGDLLPPAGNDQVPLDPTKDNDNDGYVFVDDCNDRDPAVNPGAYEVPNDGIDNDCDGVVDNPPECDTADETHYATRDPKDLARALDLCQFTTENAKGKARRWGVLGAQILRSDDSGFEPTRSSQFGALSRFGSKIVPRHGKNIAVLSTGQARTPDLPDYDGTLGTGSPYGTWNPMAWNPPPFGFTDPAPGCPPGFTTNHAGGNSVKLRLRIRVPTNAISFHFDFDFYTHSFPSERCTIDGETFVALLDTTAFTDPSKHGNIVFDAKGNLIRPDTGFLSACNPAASADPLLGQAYPCPSGTAELVGTGFDGWTRSMGAATSWLRTQAAVSRGETITLEFVIWGGPNDNTVGWDTVLIDNFEWQGIPAIPRTEPPK